jgi:hypothetical protein
MNGSIMFRFPVGTATLAVPALARQRFFGAVRSDFRRLLHARHVTAEPVYRRLDGTAKPLLHCIYSEGVICA